ncbi:ribosome maturation factor RimM [Neptunicella sp.]|uniref:ribosome maturation factor RimM n=1 Tax=Neptunicella sp. TaxID=2125986 RepID=UPI003F68EF51
MSNASDTLVVGQFGAPHGVQGWLRITSYTDDLTGIFDYSPWFVEQGGQIKTYQVEQWRKQNKGVVAKIVGIDNRDQADLLKNLPISIKAEQLPELAEDEFYWRDLIGMQVITEQGYNLGNVKELFETGSNDVLLVQANHNDAFGQKERMIPYLQSQVVKSVDREAKTIQVDWDPSF